MIDSTLQIFAIGFAGCFCAVASHIIFNSFYACLFVNNVIARLRVVIGFLFLVTSLCNFAQYLPLGLFGCVFAAKLSIVSFHLQMLSGEAFQIYRISVITGKNTVFVVLSSLLLICRLAVSVSDIVLSTSTINGDDDIERKDYCVFKQELFSGIIHVAMDAIVELFITTAITIALFKHTRELFKLQRKSSNTGLYRIIVETNVFRTIILFLINVFTMIVIMYDQHSVILTYMWSLMGIVYLYFVIYDKGMVRFLHQLARNSSLAKSNNQLHNPNSRSPPPPFSSTARNSTNQFNTEEASGMAIMCNSNLTTIPLVLNSATEVTSNCSHIPAYESTNSIAPFSNLQRLSNYNIIKLNSGNSVAPSSNSIYSPYTPIAYNNYTSNSTGFPNSIEEWAGYYFSNLDGSALGNNPTNFTFGQINRSNIGNGGSRSQPNMSSI